MVVAAGVLVREVEALTDLAHVRGVGADLLHEVAEGAADRSYGIAVAKLAGLPAAVVARARSVLAKLEAGRDATGGIAAGLDDLPLFAAAAEPERQPDELAAALAEIEPDSLSPREALEQLYRLKRLAAERDG